MEQVSLRSMLNIGLPFFVETRGWEPFFPQPLCTGTLFSGLEVAFLFWRKTGAWESFFNASTGVTFTGTFFWDSPKSLYKSQDQRQLTCRKRFSCILCHRQTHLPPLHEVFSLVSKQAF